MSKLELTAVVFSILGVCLTAKQNRCCWPVNLLATALYLIIFYQVKLYADALLQCGFIVMLIYGWYSWSTQRFASLYSVSYLDAKPFGLGLGLAVLFGLVLGFCMHRFTDAALPWLDAILTALSLLNSFWAAKKYIQSWLMWCVIDLVYVVMFCYKGLYLTAALYFLFILLALNGFRLWTQWWQQAKQH